MDGEYLAKMEDVLSLYEQSPQQKQARLCFDERPCQLLDEVVAPLPMKEKQPKREDYEYVGQGTACVLLAYDIDSGQRYCQVLAQRTKKEYAFFLQEIITTHYSDVKKVHLVQDNLNTHTYGAFYEHLPAPQARNLSQKLVFHFTPKHASWLNMAEIEFSALAKQCLDRRIKDMATLEKEVQAWVKYRNEKRVKIHWSFTVDEARQKLSKQYQNVNPNNSDPSKN